jgi:AraC-like DNA-binding protein
MCSSPICDRADHKGALFGRGILMLWSLSSRVTESSDWHEHDRFQFILCRGKSGRMLTKDGEIGFSPLRTILIPPATLHRFVVEPGETGHLKMMCFLSKDLPKNLSPLHIAMLDGLVSKGVSKADHDERGRWLDQLSDAIIDGFDVEDMWTQRAQWGALGLLLTVHAKEQSFTYERPYVRNKNKIQSIVCWIEANLTENITLDRLANDFGISRSLLTKEFRSYTGKSVVEYCNARRVQKAAIALASETDSTVKIALDSGFANLSHFHRRFKSQFGLTPAAFRRKVAEEGKI